MLDIRYIRDNADAVQLNAQNKGYDVDIKKLLDLDSERRQKLIEVDEFRAKRNENISSANGSRPTEDSIAQGKVIKEKLGEIELQLKTLNSDYMSLLKQVPNMSSPDVPVGKSEDENVVVKTIGDIPKFDFVALNHSEIATKRGWLDKERAAKVTGSRFAYVMGDLVKLQFAVIQFVINTLSDEDKITEIANNAGLKVSSRPFIPVLPPLMIRTEMYDAMDRLEPKDRVTIYGCRVVPSMCLVACIQVKYLTKPIYHFVILDMLQVLGVKQAHMVRTWKAYLGCINSINLKWKVLQLPTMVLMNICYLSLYKSICCHNLACLTKLLKNAQLI